MPRATANFGIRYPCSGETIDVDSFADWANDIDAALLAVSSATNPTLNRPRASVRTVSTGTSTAVGVDTTLNVGAETLYSDQVLVSTTGLTPDVSGIYMVVAEFSPLNTVTTLTSWAGATFGSGGAPAFGRKLGLNVANTTATNINISAPMALGPSSSVGVSWLWTGTGGPMFVYCNLSVALICEI